MENKDTHEEPKRQVDHESREASAQGFAAPDFSTGSEAPPEKLSPYPYGNSLMTNILMNVLQQA